MATGLLREARRAILPILKADAGVTALVPATSIYGQTTLSEPGWPFIKLGAAFVAERIRLPQQVQGAMVAFSVHAFARHRESGGQLAEFAEDHAGRIGAAIEAALADNNVAVTGGTMHVELSDANLQQDEEPDAFHYFAQVNCRMMVA